MDRSAKTPAAILFLAGLAITATWLLALAGPGSLTIVSLPPKETLIPQPALGTWYAVFFTDRTLERFSGGPDEALVESIEQAQLSVDIAAYELSLWSVRDALLNAHRRGLTVRVVIEADYADEEEVHQLIEAGIPVVEDDREDGWMHNKFVIVDRQGVWTGSMNFTLNGAYRNDENLLWIGSAEVAGAYLTEFEEMFEGGFFGDRSPSEAGGRAFMVNTVPVEVWFSPDDGVRDRIVALIRAAQQSVQFMAFSFTSNEIAEAILAQAEAGLLVQGVFDEGQLDNPGGEFARMLSAGLDVVLDGNPDRMHHKVIVLDGKVVITGSYNFSANAETRNDENVVMAFSEEVARAYLQEFARVRAEAERP